MQQQKKKTLSTTRNCFENLKKYKIISFLIKIRVFLNKWKILAVEPCDLHSKTFQIHEVILYYNYTDLYTKHIVDCTFIDASEY